MAGPVLHVGCLVDGCDRSHRARGLCSSHYNKAHQPNRHPKITVSCAECGGPCEKDKSALTRYSKSYCPSCWLLSDEQRDAARLRRARIAAERSPSALAKKRLARAAEGIMGHGVWTAGACARCGDTFVRHSSREPTRWCSRACRNAYRSRSRSLGGLDPRTIFERDGWRCHLCGKMTDRAKMHPHPMAPTIDHLVPKVDDGGNDAANLATAHSRCNSVRRQYGTVQLRLIG